MTDQCIEISSDDESPAPEKPRTTTVLGLLTAAAFTISYLFAYSVAGALVDSDVLPHWAPGHDPRPRWMALLFIALIGVSAVGTLLRWVPASLKRPGRAGIP